MTKLVNLAQSANFLHEITDLQQSVNEYNKIAVFNDLKKPTNLIYKSLPNLSKTFIPSDKIQQAKELSLISVYNRFTNYEYKPKKSNYCPFCGSGTGANGTGAFSINTQKNYFKCFNCDAKGDTIRFIETLNNVGTVEAVNLLLNETTAPAPGKQIVKKYEPINEPAKVYNSEIYTFVIDYLQQNEPYKQGIEYLNKRGINGNLQRFYSICTLSEKTYYKLNNELKNKFSSDMLFNCGITNEKNNLALVYPAVVIPYFVGSEIKLIETRALNPLPHYSKYNVLSGIDRVPFNSVILTNKQNTKIHLCEGVFDAISLNCLGLPALAVGGFKQVQIVNKIATYCKANNKELCIVFDTESEPTKAEKLQTEINRITELCTGLNLKLSKISIPEPYHDANDYFNAKISTDFYHFECIDSLNKIPYNTNQKTTAEILNNWYHANGFISTYTLNFATDLQTFKKQSNEN